MYPAGGDVYTILSDFSQIPSGTVFYFSEGEVDFVTTSTMSNESFQSFSNYVEKNFDSNIPILKDIAFSCKIDELTILGVGWGVPSSQGDGFNKDKAVAALTGNAHDESIHRCGEYVGKAIEAGGIPGVYADAKDFGPLLINKGFQVVSKTNYTPFKADIAVYDGNQAHKWGHVEMYSGNEWISDFFQGKYGSYSAFPSGGAGFNIYKSNIPTFTIYRWY